MQGTKGEILRHLKLSGPASVEDLAIRLGLAGMTIRQHLTALERDALVEVCDRRRGPGRTCRLYRLSPQGDAEFPRGYDILARGILEQVALLQPHEVAELHPEEKVTLLMRRYAERLAEPHLVELDGCDLETRAMRAAAILAKMSGFVDTERQPDGIAIRDFNCAYRKVVDLGSEICAWHARFLSVLLGCEVCWQSDNRSDCCSVLVPISVEVEMIQISVGVLPNRPVSQAGSAQPNEGSTHWQGRSSA